MEPRQASFGDHVRIRTTPETVRAGVAGLEGEVYGETKPSVSGVSVVGGPADDFALNVHFEERGESLWFAPELVEFLDHAAGTTIRIGDAEFVRQPSGDWARSSAGGSWFSRLFRRR